MVPVFPIDLTASAPIKRSQSPSPPQSNSRKAKASLPPGKATAKRPKDNRPASAPLPLSLREQQVCEYFSQGFTFEAIATRLGLSAAAAKEYHRRALDKHQRSTALAAAPLEQVDRSIPAKPEPAIAEPPCDCPAVEPPVLLERPNAIDLCVTSLFVTGDRVANGEYFHGRSHSPQTTIIDLAPTSSQTY